MYMYVVVTCSISVSSVTTFHGRIISVTIFSCVQCWMHVMADGWSIHKALRRRHQHLDEWQSAISAREITCTVLEAGVRLTDSTWLDMTFCLPTFTAYS